MTTLRLEAVYRTVGKQTLVRDVSLTFAEGQINLLLGPNGAGKTTLLRMCGLLDSPTSGQLKIEPGQKEPQSPALDGVTMVFQRPVIFNRTVVENLVYPLRVRGMENGEREKRIAEAMVVADLGHFAHRRARSLSGGEAQRLALARAFVTRPAVLLLDEPAANLDPASRWRIEAMVLEMRERFGTTVVLTTHDLLQARKVGEAVYFMERGRVSGPFETRSFFHEPPSDAAARFIAGVLHTGAE